MQGQERNAVGARIPELRVGGERGGQHGGGGHDFGEHLVLRDQAFGTLGEEDLVAELDRREGTSGIAEKARRGKGFLFF